jgi:hypothetical protein
MPGNGRITGGRLRNPLAAATQCFVQGRVGFRELLVGLGVFGQGLVDFV